MKNYEESEKITALGVVIFSFVSFAIGAAIFIIINISTSFLVLKTTLPESILKIGSVLGSGIGIITATAILSVKGKLKGIISSAIIAGATILIKILGNHLMDLGGYLSMNGMIGILMTLIFALVGGVLGAHLKR